jgi:hypothetical protein
MAMTVAALAAALGVTACGGSTVPGQAASPAAQATPTAGESLQGIPLYQPSHVVSKTDNSATLKSPDSVEKVTAYYLDMVGRGGWTTVHKSITPSSGHWTIKKSGHGATITVSRSGSGSGVSISTYPTA